MDRWGLCPTKVPQPGQPPQTVRLFRGVTTGHPGLADAHEGTAYPIGGHSDPIEHNDGNTNSIFTSWTTEWGTARFFATKYGQGGVILTADIPASQIVASPNTYDEHEVLVVGPVLNANAKWTKPFK